MLNLPHQTIANIKNLLLHQKKDVEKQLKSLEKDDPVLNGTPEAEESGTASWEADVHGRLTALKEDLLGLYKKITVSLFKLNKGTYGKCENCGQEIEAARLKAFPTANLCLSCSKKTVKIKTNKR